VESGIAVFRGILYAEPPVGKLRFGSPAPRQRWDGVFDASRFGPIAPQTHNPIEDSVLGGHSAPQGDDCLNLNVWTPEPGNAMLPVMVWIHGGGLNVGAGSDFIYDGTTFAREGVVTVTINYRLDAPGYLYVGDRPGSGNFRLLDQMAALTWVQENIARFGGDPANVTVAGESAGAHSIGGLLAAPGARGLFRRAILQSGAASSHQPVEAAAVIGGEILRRLGVRPGDDDALAGLSSEELLAAKQAVDPQVLPLLCAQGVPVSILHAGWGSATLMTSGTDVLPAGIDAIRSGSARDVDILIGSNADECTSLRSMLRNPQDAADTILSAVGEDGASVLDVYGRNRPGLPADKVGRYFLDDAVFRLPAIRLAEAAQQYNPHMFMFSFAWGSPPLEGKFGAGHAFETPFMWDVLDKFPPGQMAQAVGKEPPQALATTMHGAWVSFIKTGSPQHANLPEWPAYDTIRRATMRLDDESHVVDDPDSAERQLWDKVQF
jgi:para-nitrobenzyl esterase